MSLNPYFLIAAVSAAIVFGSGLAPAWSSFSNSGVSSLNAARYCSTCFGVSWICLGAGGCCGCCATAPPAWNASVATVAMARIARNARRRRKKRVDIVSTPRLLIYTAALDHPHREADRPRQNEARMILLRRNRVELIEVFQHEGDISLMLDRLHLGQLRFQALQRFLALVRLHRLVGLHRRDLLFDRHDRVGVLPGLRIDAVQDRHDAHDHLVVFVEVLEGVFFYRRLHRRPQVVILAVAGLL